MHHGKTRSDGDATRSASQAIKASAVPHGKQMASSVPHIRSLNFSDPSLVPDSPLVRHNSALVLPRRPSTSSGEHPSTSRPRLRVTTQRITGDASDSEVSVLDLQKVADLLRVPLPSLSSSIARTSLHKGREAGKPQGPLDLRLSMLSNISVESSVVSDEAGTEVFQRYLTPIMSPAHHMTAFSPSAASSCGSPAKPFEADVHPFVESGKALIYKDTASESLVLTTPALAPIPRRARFAADPITDVFVYESVDMVVLEVHYEFPPVSFGAVMCGVVAMAVSHPLMLRGSDRVESTKDWYVEYPATATCRQGTVELLASLAMALAYTLFRGVHTRGVTVGDSLRQAAADTDVWKGVVTAGLAHAVFLLGMLFSVTANIHTCKGKACPPMPLLGLAPLFAGIGSLVVDTIFLLEAVGVVVSMVAVGLLLISQLPSVTHPSSIPWALGAAAASAIELSAARVITHRLPTPILLATMRLVSFVPLVTLALSWEKQGLHTATTPLPADVLVAGLLACFGGFSWLVALRYLGVIPIVVASSAGVTFGAILASEVFELPWASPGKLAWLTIILLVAAIALAVRGCVFSRSVIYVEVTSEEASARKKEGSRRERLVRPRYRSASRGSACSSDSTDSLL